MGKELVFLCPTRRPEDYKGTGGLSVSVTIQKPAEMSERVVQTEKQEGTAERKKLK